MNCPVCGGAEKRTLQKNGRFTLYGCGTCGANFQERLGKSKKKYDESYFIGNHRAAYGKTYQEDEENIRSFSRRRLHAIRRLLGRKGKILDIGSALGTFCDEAARAGFSAEGIEISAYARKFAKDRYGIRSCASLRQVRGKFDCISFWFALEHMENPEEWIAKARSLLQTGGVLAISVPNGDGAFARFRPDQYYAARPAEHYFEPSIRGMCLLLERHGFRTETVKIFGLHPERVGFPPNVFFKTVQKILRLGDTFEIYARRK